MFDSRFTPKYVERAEWLNDDRITSLNESRIVALDPTQGSGGTFTTLVDVEQYASMNASAFNVQPDGAGHVLFASNSVAVCVTRSFCARRQPRPAAGPAPRCPSLSAAPRCLPFALPGTATAPYPSTASSTSTRAHTAGLTRIRCSRPRCGRPWARAWPTCRRTTSISWTRRAPAPHTPR